ncbi:MAG TPA: trigger factor [Thermoanaerobaculia bacterium]|nr:trigger factor [Thermoanaerobaculia bacterium]
MLIDLSDLSPVRKQIEVEIPAEAVRSAYQSVTGEFARQAKIPGFRPGKTPKDLVRKRFQKEIEEEVLDRLLPQFFTEAISGKEMVPVGSPGLRRVDPIEDGKPVRFVAEFEVKPRVTLAEYRGIEVTEPPAEVAESEVDEIVERYRDHSSTFVPVTDRDAREGDWVVVDVVSSGEGVERRTTEGYLLQLGPEAPMPELSGALEGAKPGDAVSFEKSYGDDAPNEQIRNRTVRYELSVREVKSKQKPEADDELARSIGLGETLAEMRVKLREDLGRHKQQESVQDKRRQIGEALVARHQLEVPRALLAEEMDRSMRNYARFLASQGVDLEKAELDWEDIGRNLEPEAINRVKRGLVLEQIARKEALEVSDVEVDAEIRKATQGTDQEYAEVRQRLRHDGGYEALRGSMLQGKALDLLVREARVVPKAAPNPVPKKD